VYSKNNGLPASPMITIGSFGNPNYDRARTKRKVIYWYVMKLRWRKDR